MNDYCSVYTFHISLVAMLPRDVKLKEETRGRDCAVCFRVKTMGQGKGQVGVIP